MKVLNNVKFVIGLTGCRSPKLVWVSNGINCYNRFEVRLGFRFSFGVMF